MMASSVLCGMLQSPSKRTRGQIQVIFGPMFSGKTTELIRRMKRYQIANYRCLLIKYAKDTRYDASGLSTHDQQVCNAVSATCLQDIEERARHCEVIGVDEGQFFSDCVPFAEMLAELGRTVIIAALDGTYQRKGFGDILNLVPIAESVIKLNAVCMQCYREASYTKRIGMETALEVIGGADKYMAVCRACYKLSPSKMKIHYTPIGEETKLKSTFAGRRLFSSQDISRDSDMLESPEGSQ